MKLSSSLVAAVRAVSEVEEIDFGGNVEISTSKPPGRQWKKAWFKIFANKLESENL